MSISYLRYFFLLCLTLTACVDESYYETSRHKRVTRAEKAHKKKSDIVIGVSWSLEGDLFLEGVNLALDEINAEGGISGRKIRAVINTDETNFYDPSLTFNEKQSLVLNVANSFADNLDIVAVVGHSTSDAAILASVVYQSHGIMFLAPSSTNIKLTGHMFDYVFRAIPNNRQLAMRAADYSVQMGYKRFALLRTRGDYETELVDTFSAYIGREHGAKIIFRRSFFAETVDIPALLVDLKRLNNLDAIFIVATSGLTQKIYQQSRDMGLRVPFVGGETFDTRSFLDLIEEWEYPKEVKKSIIPTVFNGSLDRNQAFIKKFKQRYGEDKHPDYLAALGYDSIKVVAHAIKRANSTMPFRIADALRYMPPCHGTTGVFEFYASNGELKPKPIFFKTLIKRDYHYEKVNPKKWDDRALIGECNNIDYDYDFIPDDLDTCPHNTKEELIHGVYKTGLLRGCPMDTDEDQLPDYQDLCPKNTAKEKSKGVTKTGCPIDSDGDTVPDYMDACPSNPELVEFIDGKNCTEDTDKDGITDDLDMCPKNTPEQLVYGINLTDKEKRGCPIDTDNDSLADYLDDCADNTPEEIALGITPKGCPADEDADGVLDYQDKCLTTPPQVEIDSVGCGLIENSIIIEGADTYFSDSSVELSLSGEKYLHTLLEWTRLPLFIKIKFIVHTDNSEESQKSIELSSQRAAKIAEYLQKNKVDPKKIEFEGRGDATPVAANTTELGRQRNRRVEIFIMNYRFKPSPPPTKKQQGNETSDNPEEVSNKTATDHQEQQEE